MMRGWAFSVLWGGVQGSEHEDVEHGTPFK